MSKGSAWHWGVALAGSMASAAWGGGAGDSPQVGTRTDEVIRLSELGTRDFPHVLDMARGADIKISTQSRGKVHVRVINMLPARRSSYVLEYGTTRIGIPAWEDPRKPAQVEAQGASRLVAPAASACIGLQGAINNLLAATDEVNVPQLLAGLEDSAASVTREMAKPGAVVAAADEKAGAPAMSAEQCTELLRLARALPSETREQFEFDLRHGSEATLRMRRGELQRGIVVRSEPREWLTHVGFTFMDNKDERYFSREIAAAPGTYEVARQGGGQDIKYAATALFTYPLTSSADGVNLGITAGLGASSENVAVVTGISGIFGDNVLLTLGVAVQEFDVLKGVYHNGQALGGSPVDSSALVDKSYKPSFMMTLGFRFGSQ